MISYTDLINLFMVSGNLMYKTGNTDITKFNDSYRKKYPITMASFTVAAISMVGLPPLAGFFSKWYLVLGTVENSNWIFLAVILVSSLLNAVYFFKIIEKMYMKNRRSIKSAGKIKFLLQILTPTTNLSMVKIKLYADAA